MYSPQLSESDIGSSVSRIRGSLPPMSTYDPYLQQQSYPRQYHMYTTPSNRSYNYAPSVPTTYTTYSHRVAGTGTGQGNVYFSLNGKLIRSYKVRNYRRAQKHALDLYPDLLQGIASSRIQFFVMRPGYSGGQYVGLKSYISKSAWPMEVDNLAEHETVGIEVRPSISFIESIISFFNRSRFL